jgi:hypothetical protein
MCKAWTAADVYSMDSCRYTLSSLPKAVSQLSMTRIRVPVCLLQGTESGPVSPPPPARTFCTAANAFQEPFSAAIVGGNHTNQTLTFCCAAAAHADLMPLQRLTSPATPTSHAPTTTPVGCTASPSTPMCLREGALTHTCITLVSDSSSSSSSSRSRSRYTVDCTAGTQ